MYKCAQTLPNSRLSSNDRPALIRTGLAAGLIFLLFDTIYNRASACVASTHSADPRAIRLFAGTSAVILGRKKQRVGDA